MSDFIFDDSQATVLTGAQAQEFAHRLLMHAADDAPTVEEAVCRLTVGRPRVQLQQKANETVMVNTRFPKSLVDWLDVQARKMGITRSQLLRNITYSAMINA